jgi:hypothetical protein
VTGVDDYRSHFPRIRRQPIATPNSRYSGATSPITAFARSVYVDYESIRVRQEQEPMVIVVLDVDHHPSRAQGILSETNCSEQAISDGNPRFVISTHPDSRKVEV